MKLAKTKFPVPIKGVVSAGDLEVLILIYKSPRGSGELKRILGIVNPSTHISRLKEEGFATTNNTRDCDNCLYQITDKGREFLDKLKDEIKEIK